MFLERVSMLLVSKLERVHAFRIFQLSCAGVLLRKQKLDQNHHVGPEVHEMKDHRAVYLPCNDNIIITNSNSLPYTIILILWTVFSIYFLLDINFLFVCNAF